MDWKTQSWTYLRSAAQNVQFMLPAACLAGGGPTAVRELKSDRKTEDSAG